MPAASTVTSGNSPVLAACPAHFAPRARSMTGMAASIAGPAGPGMNVLKKGAQAKLGTRFRPIPDTGIFSGLTSP